MPRSTPRSLPSLVLAIAFGLLGCHQCGPGDDIGNSSDLVGGDCKKDRECYEFCLTGGSFPGGTCSVGCDDDGDCPESTRCVDIEGGVCLLACDEDFECREGYGCRGVRRNDGDGDALVCIDD